MKVSEAMALCDRICGEPVDSQMKLLWLDRIEGIIYDELISTHEGGADKPPSCIEGERELLAAEPYSQLYPLYMAMENDLIMRDTAGYANNAAAFAAAYGTYADWYNRTHMPRAVCGAINV